MKHDEFEDVWEDAIADTVHNIKKDLTDIIREAVSEYIEDYYEIPSQWADSFLEMKYDFDAQVLDELINEIKIKQ